MFKTLLFFLSCQMAKAAATHEIGLEPLIQYSSSVGDRNLSEDEPSEDCIIGTLELSKNQNVTEALKPFYVDFLNVFNPLTNDPACTLVTDTDVSCEFDFSEMNNEQDVAKEACEVAGGKIFLFDLDFETTFFSIDLSLLVIEFPLCVDEDCDIDGIAAIEEKNRNDSTNLDSQATVTPSCVEDSSAEFYLKKKKNNKKKPVIKTCAWLEGKSNGKKKKFCQKKKSFRDNQPARDVCFATCCEFRE